MWECLFLYACGDTEHGAEHFPSSSQKNLKEIECDPSIGEIV